MKLLLRAGATVTTATAAGRTALHAACTHNERNAAAILRAVCPHSMDVKSRPGSRSSGDSGGRNGHDTAVSRQHSDTAALQAAPLRIASARVFLRVGRDRSPSAGRGALDPAQLARLLNRGDSSGWTALHNAAASGQRVRDRAELPSLVRAPRVECLTWTALPPAPHPQAIVEALLRCGASTDLFTAHGHSALHCAVISGRHEVGGGVGTMAAGCNRRLNSLAYRRFALSPRRCYAL